LQTNGTCGSSNTANLTSQPTTNLCSSPGAASAISGTGPWTWTCGGTNGGTPPGTCTANLQTNGTCGSSNTANLTSQPTTNLCSSPGAASAISGTGPWTWTCGGTNVRTPPCTCTANFHDNGTCGSSNTANLTSQPTTNLCSSPGAASAISGTGPWTWTCGGTNGGTPSGTCTA